MYHYLVRRDMLERIYKGYSMKAVTTGTILTPTDLYEWCVTHINNVKILFVRSEGVKNPCYIAG